MIAIVGIRYRNDAHFTLYRSCLPIYEDPYDLITIIFIS